jgi:hypothetical protein
VLEDGRVFVLESSKLLELNLKSEVRTNNFDAGAQWSVCGPYALRTSPPKPATVVDLRSDVRIKLAFDPQT